MKKFLMLFLLSASLTACRRGTVYHHYEPIPSGGWERGDTLCFDMEITDSMTRYDLSVEVRNRNDYPYRNLGVCLHIVPPSAENIPETRILHLQLADSLGRWKGTGCAGLYDNRFPAGTMTVRAPGTYRVCITSDMDDECLKGINDIGIEVTEGE